MYELTTTSFMKDSKQNLFTGQSLTKEERHGTDFNHMLTFNGRLLSESSHVIVPKKIISVYLDVSTPIVCNKA